MIVTNINSWILIKKVMIQKDIFSESKKFEQNIQSNFLNHKGFLKNIFHFLFPIYVPKQSHYLLDDLISLRKSSGNQPKQPIVTSIDSVQIKLTNNSHFQRDPQWPESPMNNIEKNTRTVSLFKRIQHCNIQYLCQGPF